MKYEIAAVAILIVVALMAYGAITFVALDALGAFE